MPVTSDPSPFTSVTASPMESHDAEDLPIELKIPLPLSNASSDEDEETAKVLTESTPVTLKPREEDVHIEPLGEALAQDAGRGGFEDPQTEMSSDLPPVTLADLARLVELETYEKDRALSAQRRLQRLTIACGVEKRLISTLTIAYGNMIDQYKTDDQAGFAGLYEACEQLKDSCKTADSPLSEISPGPEGDPRPLSTMLELSPQEQGSILAFLTRVRTEPSFLSDKISQLSPMNLTALTSSYHPAGIDFSILQNHSHGKSQFFSKDSQMMKLSRRMDNLHWFHDRDPFFALLYSVFDSCARPGSQEYNRRTDIWSAACAKTMVEGFTGSKPGSDEMAIALFDGFANFQDWPLKPKMEVYLMGVLTKGVTILEPPSSPSVNFNDPLETQNAKAAIAETDFFEDALTTLFDLLAAADHQQAVPASALSFSHAVLQKIEDPKLRIRAQQFIVIRWYFATFISSIIVYPEVRGIMMTQHIGETARRSILQKLVVKMQERVFDEILPWNHNALTNPSCRDNIMAMYKAFTPPNLPEPKKFHPLATNQDEDASSRCLMLTPLDVVGIVELLCPEHLLSQEPAEQASALPPSDRPSTGGSSTLVAGSSDIGSAVTGRSGKVEDSNLDDQKTTESITGHKSQNISTKGEPNPHSASKDPIPDSSEDLGATCRKLKTRSTRGRGILTGATPSMWIVAYYSRDGSLLSIQPDGNQSPEMSEPGYIVNSEEFNVISDLWTTRTLEAALLRLLRDPLEPGRAPLEDDFTQADPIQNLSNMVKKSMEAALSKARSKLDFRDAHAWWTNFQAYQDFARTHPVSSLHTLLFDIRKDLQDAVENVSGLARYCDAQCRSLGRMQTYNTNVLAKMEEVRSLLRMKMWYVSDVRHSAPYEETLYVTRALRAMATSKRSKQVGSVSNWARQRLRVTNVHDRAEAQTLEIMVASKDQGGVSKLADEQVGITTRWLTQRSIENFCRGEERIHRFCFEIQKSVGKLAGPSMLDSPVLWSSNLFKRERASLRGQRSRPDIPESPLKPTHAWPTSTTMGRSNTPVLSAPPMASRTGTIASGRSPIQGSGGFWDPNFPLRQPSGLGLYGNQPLLPPTPTSPPQSWSNIPYSPGSPSHIFASQIPPSSSAGPSHSRGNSEEESSPASRAFADEIKKSLCSLLVSDLDYILWNSGSETDCWINEHIEELKHGTEAKIGSAVVPDLSQQGQTVMPSRIDNNTSAANERAQSTATPAALSGPFSQNDAPSLHGSFPFSEAYAILLQRFSLVRDPHCKLRLLYELEDMIVKSIEINFATGSRQLDASRTPNHDARPKLRSKSVPRTKATSLEEVIANCTERRAGTVKSTNHKRLSGASIFGLGAAENNTPGADDIVNVFYSIFRDSTLRPITLFRDLQYIAAFVPADILDKTPQGKAFWDAGLAALALKEDLCESMVNHANTVTAYHISPHFSTSTDSHVDTALASTTLRDAANLWLITAKEGSPVAARELGLFYLTHPELLPRVTIPFSKAKDVFRSVMVNENVRAADRDRGALDPYTFAVVFHWMEIAANGGDKDAKDFLKMNGDLSGGR